MTKQNKTKTKKESIKQIVQDLKKELSEHAEVFIIKREGGLSVELSSGKVNVEELSKIGTDIFMKESKPKNSVGGYIR